MSAARGKMSARRMGAAALAAGVTIVVGLTAAPAIADFAPPATSKGTAARVEPLDTSVGVAQAEAGKGGASSSAVSARVAGHDLGSTAAQGNGSENGSLAHAPVLHGDVWVMPREADAESSADRSSSSAHTALVEAGMPYLARVEVLSGDAEAVWTPTKSTSSSQAEAARLEAGSFVIVLMHAEGSSNGEGRLYLVRINKTTLVDSNNDGPMTIEAPGVFKIDLVGAEATGGSFSGRVLESTWLNDSAGLTQLASAVESRGGNGTTTYRPDPRTTDQEIPMGSSGVPGRGILPHTGLSIALLAAMALTLIAVGAACDAARRNV